MRPLAALLPLALAAAAHAQTLGRIAAVDVLGPVDSDVPVFVEVDGVAYFSSLDRAAFTRRLWRTDGTPGGTAEVSADVQPLRRAVAYRGELYFEGRASTGAPARLYRTTAAGGVELWGGAEGVEGLAVADGALFFSAETDAEGREPYRGDDADVGLLADVCPGAGSSDPRGFAAPEGVALFSASDCGTTYGRELWKAAAATAEIAADIEPGPASSNPGRVVEADGVVYVTASGRDADGSRVGNELFAFDGVAATLVVDQNPGSASAQITFLGDVATGSLWNVLAAVGGRSGLTPHQLGGGAFVPLGLVGGSTAATVCVPPETCPTAEVWDGALFFVAAPASPSRPRLYAADGASLSEVARPPGVDRLSLPTRYDGGLAMQGCDEAETACALYHLDARGATPALVAELPAGTVALALQAFGGGLLIRLQNDDPSTAGFFESELWGLGLAGGTAAERAPDGPALELAAFPSPAAGPVTVAWEQPEAGAARVSVLDALGREVAVVAEGARGAGAQRAAWDPTGRAAGVYRVRVAAGGAVATRAVVVAR